MQCNPSKIKGVGNSTPFFFLYLKKHFKPMSETKIYMTVKEYADKKNVTVQAVYKKINEKKLITRKIGSLTLVAE